METILMNVEESIAEDVVFLCIGMIKQTKQEVEAGSSEIVDKLYQPLILLQISMKLL